MIDWETIEALESGPEIEDTYRDYIMEEVLGRDYEDLQSEVMEEAEEGLYGSP